MFSENLKKYRKISGMTQEELANKINILLNSNYTKNNVQSWERGVNPKIDVISAIAEILEITEQYLFDDSENIIDFIVRKRIPDLKDIIEKTVKIPLFNGYVGAGSGGIINNFDNKFMYVDSSTIKKKYENETVLALTVIGDSMEPYVYQDDIILFTPIKADEINRSDGKYIIETINGTMVKNLKFNCNGDIIISSCNKAYSDEIIKSNESQELLEILGLVVGRILKS